MCDPCPPPERLEPQAAGYTAHDLGTPGGTYHACGVSDDGLVAAGYSGTATDAPHAFVYQFTNYDPRGVTLTSLTLSSLTAAGAGDGPCGGSLVVPLSAESVKRLEVVVPSAVAVDDVASTDEAD